MLFVIYSLCKGSNPPSKNAFNVLHELGTFPLRFKTTPMEILSFLKSLALIVGVSLKQLQKVITVTFKRKNLSTSTDLFTLIAFQQLTSPTSNMHYTNKADWLPELQNYLHCLNPLYKFAPKKIMKTKQFSLRLLRLERDSALDTIETESTALQTFQHSHCDFVS